MNTVLIIVLVVAGLYIFFKIFQKISVDKNISEIIKQEGTIILDVRTVHEYQVEHIKESINMPLGDLEAGSASLDKEKNYVVCCASGVRSLKAVHLLKLKGFQKVYNGGSWKNVQKQM